MPDGAILHLQNVLVLRLEDLRRAPRAIRAGPELVPGSSSERYKKTKKLGIKFQKVRSKARFGYLL